MSRRLITGVIFTEQKPVIFSSKEKSFEFSFMTDSVYSLDDANSATKISASDGFIFGSTHDNHSIAIYVGKASYEVLCSNIFNTTAYIESHQNGLLLSNMEFDGI
ncbi:MAG: hypothetical protein ACI4J7_00640, partial [Ruminiclostridium sp.]